MNDDAVMSNDDPIDREADGEQGQQRLGQGEKQHS